MILYIYIAFLWRIQRANLVVGTIAAAGTKCATSTSLLAYEYVHSYCRRYGDLTVVQHRLVIGIFLVLNLWKLFNTLAHLASVRCSKIVLYTEWNPSHLHQDSCCLKRPRPRQCRNSSCRYHPLLFSKATAHQPVVLHVIVNINLLLLYIQVITKLSPSLTVPPWQRNKD